MNDVHVMAVRPVPSAGRQGVWDDDAGAHRAGADVGAGAGAGAEVQPASSAAVGASVAAPQSWVGTGQSPWCITGTGDGAAWHLSTAGSSLVVGVDDGVPVQRHWGAPLPQEALAELVAPDRLRWNSTFQRPAELDEQLPVDGGQRWGVPSLQVRFANEVRALELRLVGAEVRDVHGATGELRLQMRDPGYDLEVVLGYRLRSGTDVIERWTEIIAAGAGRGAVEVLRADSGSWSMPDQVEYRISAAHGYWGGETQLERTTLPFGEHVLTSRQGTTGHTHNPWVMLDDGSSDETHGEVRTVALAWSGSWRLTTTRRPEGGASVTGGFGHDGLVWRLVPGERLVTPSAIGLYSADGFGGASRRWHRFVRAHVLEHGDEVRPVLFNSWEATGFDLDEDGQASLAARAAAVGVELFVVDDGWFGGRTHNAAGLGDWWANPDRFPAGLERLAETVRGHGMDFGVWVEPEMVNPDSALYRSRPHWTHHWPGRHGDLSRNQLVLNFGRDDVREWALSWLDDLVGRCGLTYLKWDMNRPFTQAGWPDRRHDQDWLWIEHTRGVYGVLDQLRARHPDLRVESCSSGGARLDLGILARTDQVWPSDTTDALDRQVVQHGFSQLYPAGVMASWVTEAVNGMTGRAVPLEYRFHVSMAGVLGLGGDLDTWDAAELRQVAALVEQYKQARRTIQLGDLHRLGGTPGVDATALQYVSAEQVVVLMYEPHRSLARTPRRLRLVGLDPQARYRDRATGHETSGALLTARGLLFNAEATQRGWDNTRFSAADYASSLIILDRLP